MPSLFGWMPPWMQTSVAPRATASRSLPSMSSQRAVVGVLVVLVAREAAEAAADVADVGEVDVAADDVGDRRRPRRRSARGRRPRISACRSRPCAPSSTLGVGARELAALERALEHARALGRSCRARQASDRVRRPSACDSWSPGGPAVGVGRAARSRAHISGSKRSGRPRDVLGVDATAGRAARSRPPRCGARRSSSVGPGRLGIDEVDRERRDAAPVVDARAQQQLERRRRQVRRRLQVHRGPEHEPRERGHAGHQRVARHRHVAHRACPASGGRSARSLPGCGRRRSCELADREQRVDALRRRSRRCRAGCRS